MAFPKKFKHLLELKKEGVELPDYAWLTYSVCACEKDSCGWGGWTIEAVFKKNSTDDQKLSADDDQKCPECGKDLFRTNVSIKFEPSKDQAPKLVSGVDYESVPIEYEED